MNRDPGFYDFFSEEVSGNIIYEIGWGEVVYCAIMLEVVIKSPWLQPLSIFTSKTFSNENKTFF